MYIYFIGLLQIFFLHFTRFRCKPWVEIYSGVVVGNGRGRKSHIPNLLPIMVEEQSVLSLFIQTKSNHLSSSEFPYQYLGVPLYKNKYLKICVGAKRNVYPFNGSPKDISNRWYNGDLEYQIKSDALFLPIQKTLQTYKFSNRLSDKYADRSRKVKWIS